MCRSCGELCNLTLAHVMGREHDKKDGYKVLPARVVCLCGPVGVQGKCHTRYDAHELDLFWMLEPEEIAQAVEDAGSPSLMLKRTAPLAYNRINAVAA